MHKAPFPTVRVPVLWGRRRCYTEYRPRPRQGEVASLSVRNERGSPTPRGGGVESGESRLSRDDTLDRREVARTPRRRWPVPRCAGGRRIELQHRHEERTSENERLQIPVSTAVSRIHRSLISTKEQYCAIHWTAVRTFDWRPHRPPQIDSHAHPHAAHSGRAGCPPLPSGVYIRTGMRSAFAREAEPPRHSLRHNTLSSLRTPHMPHMARSPTLQPRVVVFLRDDCADLS